MYDCTYGLGEYQEPGRKYPNKKTPQFNRLCAICGAAFVTHYPTKKFCGYDCQLENHKRTSTRQYREQRKKRIAAEKVKQK